MNNKRFTVLAALLLTAWTAAFAGEPTTAPSNVLFSNITCSSATIRWTTGDGPWNIVVIKEAAAVDSDPVDGSWYTSNTVMGSGSQLGTGNFVCYSNLAAASQFNVTGLKMNTKYYVNVYAHDGISSNPDYLTSSKATNSFTTSSVVVDFDFRYTDTCQFTNKVTFINKSNISFTGATFIWRLYNNSPAFDQEYVDSFDYTWTKPGNKKIELYLVPIGGCAATATKSLLIYPRAKPGPYVIGADTQCYNHGNNHFYFNENTTADFATGIGLRRNWYFPNDTFSFPNPDVKNLMPGNYRILYEGYTIFNNRPTGCYDTAYIDIRVVPDPTSGVRINDSIQCLKGNQFGFDNVYPGLVSFSWDFGDGSPKSLNKQSNHAYTTVGDYNVIHSAASSEGCVSSDTSIVLVKPNMIATFSPLPTSLCEGSAPLKMKATKTGGYYTGQYVTDSTFNPSTPGTYQITHIVPDQFCPDTSKQNITVNPLPRFNLGADANLCNGGTATLNITAPGTYIWDDGTNAASRTISTAGLFWAEATDNGCVWRDSINLFLGTSPVVQLPLDTLLCKGGVLKLHAYYPGSKTLWSNGSTDTTIYVSGAGTYTVTVTNPCGTATDNITINYQGEFCDVFIPDAFTPNADGRNEVFQITGRGITPMSFLVYNRWGQIVFDSRTSNTYGWDGYYNGEPCPDGMYTYLFRYEVITGDIRRRNTIKGSVLLYH